MSGIGGSRVRVALRNSIPYSQRRVIDGPLERSRDTTLVGAMFDGLAPRYDAVNRLLSLRRDQQWRSHAAGLVAASRPHHVLDIATGTGDLLMAVARRTPTAVLEGVDIASSMLRLGRLKAYRRGLSARVTFQCGDAIALPYHSNSFDVTTIAFGFRNVENRSQALQEMLRVLTPGGRVLILEFSLPAARALRSLYLLYFRHVLPVLGGMIAGDVTAYRYLNRTVELFAGTDLVSLLTTAGFVAPKRIPLTFGVASIYIGRKAAD